MLPAKCASIVIISNLIVLLIGDPVQKSQVEVMITIVDQATPVFDQPFYSVSVPESVPLHSTLITIFASSPTGGKLVYSIIKGDDYGEFAVDFNTGK